MRLVLVGVPGSGKSTIIKQVLESGAASGVVDFGNLILSMSSRYGIKHRDEIRKKLTPDQFRRVQEKAALSISKMKGNIIIDTHATIKTPLGYFPGLPANVITKMKPDIIVLLEFNPSDIYKRRKSDASRVRDMEDAESIDLQQELNRYFVAAAASQSNAYVKIISLKDKQKIPYQHSNRAAEEIIKALMSNK